MNNLQKKSPFFSALFTMPTLFAAVLITILCFGNSTASRAQSAPAEQSIGAIDPLLENFKSPHRRNYDYLKNIPAGDVSRKQTEASAPTDGELDPSLNVNIDSIPGNVRATVLQPDGKILVGGYFRTVNGVRQKSISRLNADFTLDSSFSAEVNGTILAIAVQTDGKIVIGGSFTSVGGASRNHIARLNADGSLDTTFDPGNGADALVYDVAIQSDGKILVGGNFFQINLTNNYGIARLNADGSVDTSFASPIPAPIPNPSSSPIPGIIYSIALQTDGKIIIGGFIVKNYNPLITTPIARLNQGGSFDSSFNPGTINSNALKVAVQSDGKILMAGYFTTINGVNSNFIARLNADGSLDISFKIGTGANSPILTIFVQSDGKILLGGLFSSFNGTSRNRVARLNTDGTLDTTFNPGSSSFLLGTIQSITALSGGKVLVGGALNGGIFSSDSIRVFNADGSTDSSVRFSTTALGGVRAIAVQPDGKIIVAGNFNRPGGNSLSQVFRLNPDGSIDTTFGGSSGTFSISSNGQINSIVIQPNGKIILAGYNLGYAVSGNLGVITSIARFNADGTADESFSPGNIRTSRGINAAALQSDGKIVVVWGYNQSNGFPTGGVARLNSDGSIDSTFNNTLPAAFFDSVVIQPDGKILVGGAFNISFVNSQTGSVSYNGVVRLNADGSRDTTFVPATTSNFETGRVTEVSALALQTDGKILVGGRIYAGIGAAVFGIARLNQNGALDTTFNLSAISGVGDIARVEDIFPLSNGKILIGGFFDRIGTSPQNNIARLNADGSIDNSFITTTDNTVYKITTQTDGKVLIGGDFETVNGIARTSLARLLSEPIARRTKFDFDGDGKADISVFRPDNGVWYLLNSQNGFTAAQFGVSSDKLVPADYDGDGKTDLAVYRGGTWYLNRSSAGFIGFAFGAPDDIPQPADFDGDGKAELAVWRPSNGTWYVFNLATNQFNAAQFGASTDKPVAGDYDGDAKADYAVFRPSNGTWYLNRSSIGFTGIQFGEAADKPVPADYDGDNKTDIAVFRPSNGTWYRLNSSNGQFVGMQFGIATDLPIPADYDGDGKSDIAVFRNGIWYIQQSTNGFTGVQFGTNSDKPVPNVYIP